MLDNHSLIRKGTIRHKGKEVRKGMDFDRSWFSPLPDLSIRTTMLTDEGGKPYSSQRRSEMNSEFDKGGKFQKVLTGGRLIDGFMLQNPGEIMWDEDSVEAGGESGIDV